MTKRYWLQVLERAIKSFAQVVVLTFGADQVDAFTADWQLMLGLGLGAAVLSVATSLASIDLGPDESPSLV